MTGPRNSTTTNSRFTCPTCGGEAWEADLTAYMNKVPFRLSHLGLPDPDIGAGELGDYEIDVLRCEDGHEWPYRNEWPYRSEYEANLARAARGEGTKRPTRAERERHEVDLSGPVTP